jgi:carbamoylphosphate synthase small subunit
MQANDEIFFIATVPEEYFNNFLSNHSEFQSHRLFKSDPFSIKQRIKEALHQENLLESTSISKKIAIINFSASVANLDRLKPKIHIEGLYTGQFYQFGDRWRSYRILNNDVPSVEEINSQNVLLLSGSSHSVNNLCPPMKKFAKNLLVSLSVNKQLKILGTCFGHQFLAHLNGASVAKRNFVKGT